MKKLNQIKNAALGLTAIGLLALGTTQAHAGAIITSGRVALGVNDEGHLNFYDPSVVETVNAGYTGLAYQFDDGSWRDSTAPGCLCEGWGVSGSGHGAGADISVGGVFNLTLDSFSATASSITSEVHVSSLSDLNVRQAYGVAVAGALFEDEVTIKNTGAGTITDVRYVRVMDWDVPMTEFFEFVTILGTGTTTLLERSHDNGFNNPNPLGGDGSIIGSTEDVDFTDVGPADHGAYFRFALGDLAPGAEKKFKIYYGAAGNEADMLAALGSVGIELFSLGQSSVYDPDTGTYRAGNELPTYAFGFKGVGGRTILPNPVPEPSTWMLLSTGLVGLVGYARRRQLAKA